MFYMMNDRFDTAGASLDFLRRRIIRIVPLYWIATTMMLASLIAAPQIIIHNGLDLKHVVASYAFIPWPRADGQLFPIHALGWTLNYEMVFYAIFALALLLPLRAGLTTLVAIFALLILVGALVPERLFIVKFWGDPIIGEFLLGIGIAGLYLSGRRLSAPVAIALILGGIALAVVFFQITAYEYVWRLITGGIPAGLIVMAAVLGPSLRESFPVRLLAVGGDASYALYLTHSFTIKLFGVVAIKLGLPLILMYVLGFMLTILASVPVHLFVEQPINHWLLRKTAKPKPAVSVAS